MIWRLKRQPNILQPKLFNRFGIPTRGITAIELVMALSVLMMIASFIITVLIGQTRAKGRDALREHDIKELQNALNLYVNNVRSFPACPQRVTINGVDDCLSKALLKAQVIDKMPVDPKNIGNCSQSNSYVYCYQAVSGGFSYILEYRLETNGITMKSAGWHSIQP